MKLFVTVLLIFMIGSGFAQESGQVIMTELLWNPASSESNTQTQVIEIANTTGSAINLNGWTIDDEDTDGPNTLPNVTLPAFGIAIICGGSEADYISSFGVGPLVISLLDNGQTMFNMSNSPSSTSEIIQLRDAGSVLVDEVNYDDASPWPGDPDGVSNYLSIPKNQMNATSNNDGANWSKSAVGVDGAYQSTISTTWNAVETTSFGNILGDQTLPVELTSFTATAGDGLVTLRWKTASELENQGFAVLRANSEDGVFEELDSYMSNDALRGAGTSSQSHSYQFIDRQVFNGLSYWYKLVDIDNNGVRKEHGTIKATPESVVLEPVAGNIPQTFALHQNVPNPFNPSTKITFDIPALQKSASNVTVTVSNIVGQKIATLFSGTIAAGSYTVEWNGLNQAGSAVPSGIYIYSISSEGFSASRRMVLVK